jgi:uncharacterized membrane protein YebE (DUF533 family)
MDEAKLLQSVLSGVLGGRRKRGRRTMRHLVGSTSGLWSNPTVLLTAAGLAWGLIESVQGQSAPAGQPGTPMPSAPLPPLPVMPQSGSANASAAAPSDALRLVRLAISAGQADGAMGDTERAEIARVAAEQGLGDVVSVELSRRLTLAEIVAGVTDQNARVALYGLAYAVVRADEQVNGAERIYLAQLAHLLGLDPATVARLEATTAARIDAADSRDSDA